MRSRPQNFCVAPVASRELTCTNKEALVGCCRSFQYEAHNHPACRLPGRLTTKLARIPVGSFHIVVSRVPSFAVRDLKAREITVNLTHTAYSVRLHLRVQVPKYKVSTQNMPKTRLRFLRRKPYKLWKGVLWAPRVQVIHTKESKYFYST